MRWIFITLAVVNLLVFAWGLVADSGEQAPVRAQKLKNPYGQYPEIMLLSEVLRVSSDEARNSVDIPEVTAAEGLSGQEDTVAPLSDMDMGDEDGAGEADDGSGNRNTELEAPELAIHDDKLLCELVGPFESSDIASDFVERLKAIEVGASLRDLELPAGPGYWVYLEPKPTRREALRVLSELQSKRIDSYVIPKGELANGISLGMFSRKQLSDARVKEMLAIGLEPLVQEIERSYREIWVMLDAGVDSKMSSLSWERAMEGIKGLERRQNYCLDVAS
ncbi:MAG: SPOR domain-containing protein [Agarilytica sp.]